MAWEHVIKGLVGTGELALFTGSVMLIGGYGMSAFYVFLNNISNLDTKKIDEDHLYLTKRISFFKRKTIYINKSEDEKRVELNLTSLYCHGWPKEIKKAYPLFFKIFLPATNITLHSGDGKRVTYMNRVTGFGMGIGRKEENEGLFQAADSILREELQKENLESLVN